MALSQKTIDHFYLDIKSFTPAEFYHSGKYSLSAKILLENHKKISAVAMPKRLINGSIQKKVHDQDQSRPISKQIQTTFKIQNNGKIVYLNQRYLFQLSLDSSEIEWASLTLELNRYFIDKQTKGIEQKRTQGFNSNIRLNEQIYSHYKHKENKKKVDQYKLNINISGQVKENVAENFRKATFLNREYFSVVHFVISHARISHEISSIQSLKSFQNEDSLSLYKKLIIEPWKTLRKLSSSIIQLKQQINSFFNIDQFSRFMIPEPPALQLVDEILQRYETNDINELCSQLFYQSKALQQHIVIFWAELLNLFLKPFLSKLQYYFQAVNNQSQLEFLKEEQIQSRTIFQKNQASLHKSSLQAKKQKYFSSNSYRYSIKKPKKFVPEFYILLPTIQIFEKQPIQNQLKGKINHITNYTNRMNTLFVLVHGYYGSKNDMELIRAFINSLYQTNILCVQFERFDKTIEQLGKQLSQQMAKYFQSKSQFQINKINFIGFSLGGIIIRASLKHLKKYNHMFKILITLSTPHLGILQSQTCCIRFFSKFITQLKKHKILKELHLKEKKKNSQNTEQLQICSLEKLAMDTLLKSFQLVIFYGGINDLFVPTYSSALQYQGNDHRILNMQKQILRNSKNIHLITTQFSYKLPKHQFIDYFISKNVHLNFISDPAFIYLLFSQYGLIL